MLNQRRIAAQAREGRAVVRVGRREGVENLGEAMRSGIAQTVERGFHHDRRGGEAEHGDRIDQHRQHREFHFAGFDLFAEIFRRASNHQARDKDGDDGENEEAIKTRANAAGRDAAEQHVEQRHEPAERRERNHASH